MSVEPGKAARNEIRKLRAAYINNLAVAIMVAGLIAPYVAYTMAEDKVPFLHRVTINSASLLAFWVIGCMVLSFMVHRWAKIFLEDIED
ncbi:hypothetical protein AB4Y85_18135 [Microvirga sp. 2YAF29]|uniref:hypothetical protein n=1 Tax=Microvirga sp. 2YAF29 TaxID=3233031 RepID=UPI003F971C94